MTLFTVVDGWNNPLSGATVEIWDNMDSVMYWSGQTNSLGQCSHVMGDGLYHAIGKKAGYTSSYPTFFYASDQFLTLSLAGGTAPPPQNGQTPTTPSEGNPLGLLALAGLAFLFLALSSRR